jgi:hypothetical protein
MGLNAPSDAQLYMHNRRQCDDSLLKKKCLSFSSTRAIRMRDQGAEKFRSLKDFEVCVIHKKEPWAQRIRFINLIGMVICPKQKIKVDIARSGYQS